MTIADDLQAHVLGALAHPTRLRIMRLLRGGEKCVCEIVPELGIRQANVSQHLAILRSAGLVEARRKGQSIYYRVRDRRILSVMDRVGQILADQLAKVEDLAVALRA